MAPCLPSIIHSISFFLNDAMTTPNTATATAAPGIIALLDLPPGTSVTVDGSTHTIRRDDFVGISSFPRTGFHLVVVSSAAGGGDTSDARAASTTDVGSSTSTGNEGNIPKPSALHTAGFMLMRNFDKKNEDGMNTTTEEDGWIIARRYDGQTEEMSCTPVDDVTTTNLLRAVKDGTIGPQRVVSYESFLMQQQQHRQQQQHPIKNWKNVSAYITPSLLERRHIVSGEKIVPGSYENEEGRDGDSNDKRRQATPGNSNTDGTSICYPPIPCIEGSPSSSSTTPAHISRTGHGGTKRYLSHLSPSDRTALFLDAEPGSRVLEIVLKQYYDGRWEELVGDVQLSFLLFLHLGCLSSFEHWRDCISMLSFAGAKIVSVHAELYTAIIHATSRHLSWIERDFFEEVEYSGGNFFIPALNRFIVLSSECGDEALLNAAKELGRVVQSRFGVRLAPVSQQRDGKRPLSGQSSTSFNGAECSDEEEEEIMEVDMRDGSVVDVSAAKPNVGEVKADIELPIYDGDDDDGPVIVSEEDVEASLARSAATSRPMQASSPMQMSKEDKSNRKKYPLIYAAMAPQEDIVMTCARVLDDATDVSLVREAAAYLEEVERKRACN